jgi:thiol:disulfide interchange protein
MINFLKEKEEEKDNNNTVSVIDNYLVLSITNTDTPVIWRMALDEIGTAVFSIKNEKTKSKLILKQKDGKEESISSFKNKEEAAEILSSISNSLLKPKESKSGKKLKTQTIPEEAKDNTEKKKWGIALILAFLIIGLYIYLTSLIPENMIITDPAVSSGATSGTAETRTGQPMSADEFLKGL